MAKLTGRGLATFAKSKVGTPYVYGAKGADGKLTLARLNSLKKSYPDMFTTSYYNKAKKYVGRVCCDCSGLISWYTGKVLGSYQLYSTASKRAKINKNNLSKIPVGAVVWKTGHVGVYLGNGKVAEAMGIDYGCKITKLKNRTFTHWLLFSYIDYGKTTAKSSKPKSKNPYKEPSGLVMYGNKGEGVKWVQWELRDAGIKVDITGKFNNATLNGVKKYQKSCKITVDGKVGNATKGKFKND